VGYAVKMLTAIIGTVIIIVALPIFAGMVTSAASAGIISMQTTIVQFMPIFGIGAALAILGAFGLYKKEKT